MRSRCIPPRTLGRVMAQRTGLGPGARIALLRQNLLAAQSRLRQLAEAAGGGISATGLSAMPRAGRPDSGPAVRPAHGADRRGRPCRRPRAAGERVDVPPPCLGRRRGPARHATIQTADAYVVRIDFPSPVRRADVHWELHGDVLEVEYRGQEFRYDHAFLVPPNVQPRVEQDAWSLTLRFARHP
ncbi:MAG: Hsp20/alpha crystallin family protein [Chloroflexi bacterium]|nr:Hsp20/alpha crystallin family protein [Chloroflexota bacterium]